MAKRKSRSSNKALSYIKYGAIIFSIVALCMAFLTFVSFNITSSNAVNYTGFQVIFGYAKTTLGITTTYLSFSIVAMLAIFLPLIASFSVVFKNKIIRLVGAIIMVAGAVLCFLMPNFVVSELYSASNLSLGVGAILSGVFFALGAVCNIYAVIEK